MSNMTGAQFQVTFNPEPELGEPHTVAHCLVRDNAGRMWEYY